MRPFRCLCASAFAAFFVAGCATYPEQVDEIKNALSVGGKSPDAERAVCEAEDKKNLLLALQEKGRLAQLRGDWKKSATAYAEAIALHDSWEDKALISIGDALDSTLAVAYGSDASLDYPVVGFEKTMLYVLDGFSRLGSGDLDGFGVDMRNLERCRGLVKARMSRELEALGKRSQKTDTYLKYSKGIQTDSAGATRALYSVDNPYGLLLSALWRERRGDAKEALGHYADIKCRSAETNVVATGIMRCKGKPVAAGFGEVVVFIEEGFAPEKALRRGNPKKDSILYMTIPDYTDASMINDADSDDIVIFKGTKEVAKAKLFCDLGAFAKQAHDERLEGIVLRKALTSGIKTSIIETNNAFNSRIYWNPIHEVLMLIGGTFTALTADVLSLTDEQPDLRSWLLLPRQVKVARFTLKAGKHNLTLDTANGKVPVSAAVAEGGLTVIYCISVPGAVKCFSQPIGTDI